MVFVFVTLSAWKSWLFLLSWGWSLSCLTFEDSLLRMCVSLLENCCGRSHVVAVIVRELENEVVFKNKNS